MKAFHIFCILVFAISCKPPQPEQAANDLPPEGDYLGLLNIQGHALHFKFNLDHQNHLFTLYNGDETFEIKDFKLTKDSLVVPMHIFDTKIKAKFVNGIFKGNWIKSYTSGYEIPFTAISQPTESEETSSKNNYVQLATRYSAHFETEEDENAASVAEFVQHGNSLKGTFLTKTGDYRYLTGKVTGNKFSLGTFDGERAFVFTGTVGSDGTISGHFYSGKSWHEKWSASPDEKAVLADASNVTSLKTGSKTLRFTGKALDGTIVNKESELLRDKAFILQLMGTWCPNCMDETAYLSEWYRSERPANIELVSLAFERKNQFKYAKKRLEVLKGQYQIDYPLLFGGSYQKDEASATLPELNELVAYPTLIFYNSKHEVVHIHTGFTGPGTGEHYDAWKKEFAALAAQIAK